MTNLEQQYQIFIKIKHRIIMSQHKEDNQKESDDLQQLRQKVKLSSNKLLQLTYNDSKFVQKLVQLNVKAKELILQDFIEEALIYLGEAERVLEYGASCGKTIDRNIIICTLHNEACCYYKASDLVTASKYVEAVIFNVKTHLESVNSSPSQSSASDHQRGHKSDELMCVALQKKIELVQYYLKYCTINSQAKNRIIALDASKRVIQVLKSLFTDFRQNEKLALSSEGGEGETQDLRILLKQLKVFKDDIHLGQIENYLTLTRFWIKKWNQNKIVKKINFNLQKHISNYSISEVIDMLPIQYSGDNCEGIAVNPRCIMRQILHFSMGYFTISTEYRLVSQQLYKKQEERIKSQEYIKSNIYHLLSILFLAMHLNCDLLFMKQIISSYEHHFKTTLIQEQLLNVTSDQLAQRLLFQKPITHRKSINHSLVTKIKKLKSKSKQKKVHTQYEDASTYQSKACYTVIESKEKSRSKRSVSNKPKLLDRMKKTNKVLNDSLFQSTKNLNISKEERSISGTKKMQFNKKRSVSKDSQKIKPIKQPIKVVQKASKKANDQYQLSNAKCQGQGRKRITSVSSADLSCTSKEVNKTKLNSCQKQGLKKLPKKKVDVKSKNKKGKQSKQTFSKHYYV